jgi:uncharacterized membrane protein YczE
MSATRLAGQLVRLYLGLACFGASLALMVRARLGLGPWDVLHQGLAERFDLPIGWVVNGVGAVVLLAWIPLRVRPGLGTVSNVVGVGIAVDAVLRVLPAPGPLSLRVAFLVAGILGTAVGTGLYIGAGLGPGPRDGLMTGLARRGFSVRAVRTAIEVCALAAGFALGGSVGIGTVVFALAIGPLVQLTLPLLAGPVARHPEVSHDQLARRSGCHHLHLS